MDPAHVSRLQEEQLRSLDETLASIKKWEKFSDDYTALQERLQMLPDKVSHNIMVPFGPVAFMPGQIVHTNEIMVLLGDNWFAERSAKQACEIIDRRKEHLQSMLSDLAKQRHLLESRLGFTSELKDMSENKGDLVEIREEYDPEKEAKWREERRKKQGEGAAGRQNRSQESNKLSPQKASQQGPTAHGDGPLSSASNSSRNPALSEGLKPLKTEEHIGVGGGMKEVEETGKDKEEGEGGVAEGSWRMTEEELWARLDELERQEEELDELALMSEGEEPEDHIDEQQPEDNKEGRHVRWRDDENGNISDDGEECDSPTKPATITFKHTQQADTKTEVLQDPSSSSDPTGIPTAMTSPADIYKQYMSQSTQDPEGVTPNDSTPHNQNQPLKSILKGGSNSHPLKAAEGVDGMHRKEEKEHVILAAPPSAFSGQVMERSDGEEVQNTATPPPPASSTESSAAPKRVSRFKAARQLQR